MSSISVDTIINSFSGSDLQKFEKVVKGRWRRSDFEFLCAGNTVIVVRSLIRYLRKRRNAPDLTKHEKQLQKFCTMKVGEVFTVKICEEFGFSPQFHAVFTRSLLEEEIITIAHLCKHTARQLLGLPGIGERSVRMIQHVLAEYDL